MNDAQIAAQIFHRYSSFYDGGCNRRSHWWVEKDGRTIDPQGDYAFEGDPFRREVAHRSLEVFQGCVEENSRYRIKGEAVAQPIPSHTTAT